MSILKVLQALACEKLSDLSPMSIVLSFGSQE